MSANSWGQKTENNFGIKSIKIAGLQMDISTEIDQNKITIINNIKEAAKANAKFLVTPEGSLSGYHSKFNQEDLNKALQEIIEAAINNNIGLFLGTCYKEQSGNNVYCFNQVRAYSSNGDFLGAQSKYLLCSPIDYPGTGEMNDYVQGSTNIIESEGIKFGILICNDLWATPGYTTIPNPYLPLKVQQLGAEVILHSINSGTNQKYKNFHESSVEIWADALQIPIMEVNAAKGSIRLNARSGLINKNGERINIVPDVGEHLFYCNIELKD